VSAEAQGVREAQADAQKDLDAALPALANAMAAVNGLEKSQISEMKALPNPPVGVRMVMEAICIMFKEKTDWDTAKKMLSNMGFLKSLQDYDKESVFPLIKKLKPYLDNEMFQEEAMLKIRYCIAAQR
jgi:dynein heavy chain